MQTITLHDRLKNIMEPHKGYTLGMLRRALCPTQSATGDYLIADAVSAGYLQEVAPVDGVNRLFRLNQ